MSSIFNALRIWVVRRANVVYVMAPNDTGLPEPVDEHVPVLRAAYLSPEGINERLEAGNIFLDPPNGVLLVRAGDSEAPPATSALIFVHEAEGPIGCKIGSRALTLAATSYVAPSRDTMWTWNNDLRQGKFGYFQIGMKGQSNLWRIRRAEADFADRHVFTIAPIVQSNGLPHLDLSSIADSVIRQHLAQHWSEFCEVYARQLPYRSVNAARDICEYLFYDILRRSGAISTGKVGLGDLLACLHDVLQKGNVQRLPLAWMHFHLAQKIRLLHGSIHISKVAQNGALSPELALSVGVDLVEILSAAGLAKP